MRAFLRKYRIRLLSAFIAMMLLSAAFLVAALYESYCSDVLYQELKRMLSIARASAHKIQLYLDEEQQLLHMASQNETLIGALLRQGEGETTLELERALYHNASLLTSCDALYLFDAAGRQLSSIYCRPGQGDGGETGPALNVAAEGGFDGIGEVFTTGNHSYAISIHCGVYADGNRLGTLVSVVSLQQIYDHLLHGVHLGDNGYQIVLDMDGTILYHPNRLWIGENVIAMASTRTDAFARLVETQYRKERGKEIYKDPLNLENESPGIMKLQAYCRANLGKHFFIAATVLQYDEAIAITRSNLEKAALLLSCCIAILIGCLLLIVDSRRRQREALLQSQYLSELNMMLRELNDRNEHIRHIQRVQTIGTFTSGIAHEFKNMLTPILAYSEMLMNRCEQDSVATDQANEINLAALRAQDLIRQLLQFSRKDDESSTFKPIELNELLAQSVRLAKSMLTDNVSLKLRLPQDRFYVLGRKDQLHQCVINLCKNAWQAMDGKSGEITISLQKCAMQELPRDCCPEMKDYENCVEIRVADHGTGMTAETMQRIFDPFFTTKPGSEGTGLGLSIVREIVNRHGGCVIPRSEFGAGSEFILLLPQLLLPQMETQDAEAEIMVLCQSGEDADAFCRMLQRRNYRARAFQEPGAALDALRENPTHYRLLLTDYALPGMTGTTLAHNAKRIRKDLPVILRTGLVKADVLCLNIDGIIDLVLSSAQPADEILKEIEEMLHRGEDVEK